MVIAVILVVLSYLIGSVSPGVMLARHLKGVDIRKHGSGNTGATNVMRVIGPGAAAVAFVVDTLKGAAAVYLGHRSSYAVVPLLCGAAAIVGHNWPLFTGFRGGKGMATTAGIIFSIDPLVGGCLLGVFAIALALSRYVSVASMVVAVALVPALALHHHPARDLYFGLFLAALVLWRHRSNMQRLREHRESRIGHRAASQSR